MKLKSIAPLALGAAALLALTGCAQGGGTGDGGDSATISLRLWDEQVANAYEDSIAAFEAANPGITVELNVVPWADYFTTLRTDVAAGVGDDVFWLNGASYRDYVDNGYLVPIGETLGADASSAWNSAVVDQYTRDGELWGVPQLTDGGSAYYYNADLLSAAGVTPEQLSEATWHPTDPAQDTLLPLLKQLTVDTSGRNANDPNFDSNAVATYGFNAGQDLQNIMLNFIGSNGGTFQDEDGNLTLTDLKTQEAIAYLVRLINLEHVAPPASSTNGDGDFTRDEFLMGNIAVFSSGTYNLKNVNDGATFAWGVTEMAAGPVGQVTTAPGVIAAGNANSEHPEATKALLEWLGSTEGNEFIGATGSAVPAVTEARAVYDEFWAAEDVDVSAFFTVLEGNEQIAPITGQNFAAQLNAYKPILDEVFLGRTDVATGLKEAEEAGNAAI